jgi:hypothetical protein
MVFYKSCCPKGSCLWHVLPVYEVSACGVLCVLLCSLHPQSCNNNYRCSVVHNFIYLLRLRFAAPVPGSLIRAWTRGNLRRIGLIANIWSSLSAA